VVQILLGKGVQASTKRIREIELMEMLLLSLFIILSGLAIAYAGEIYLYLSLVFGSTINDIQNKIKKFIGKK